MADALPENAIQPATRAAWRRWLERHHTRDKGVWFVYFKKSSGKQRFTYDDLVEEALCFGWIDGQARTLDAERAMLWLSPRKPKSVWSAPNKVRVARVIAAGLMHPAGQAKVDAAQANGHWTALDATTGSRCPMIRRGARRHAERAHTSTPFRHRRRRACSSGCDRRNVRRHAPVVSPKLRAWPPRTNG
jgi:uncharacterized protein YdeI (YjbR/CyaY-like superfamily)